MNKYLEEADNYDRVSKIRNKLSQGGLLPLFVCNIVEGLIYYFIVLNGGKGFS